MVYAARKQSHPSKAVRNKTARNDTSTMKFNKLTEGIALTTSEWEKVIDERLFSERDRYIMKRLLLDDAKYELISEEVGLSTRYTKAVAARSIKTLIHHIKNVH